LLQEASARAFHGIARRLGGTIKKGFESLKFHATRKETLDESTDARDGIIPFWVPRLTIHM
jgi:hypothetical protein